MNRKSTQATARAGQQNQQTTSASLMRQWQLLQLLPSHGPGATVTELLAALNDKFQVQVKRRTVERDLETLSLVFPLDCNDKSKPFGWFLSRKLQLPQMTLPEALLLCLAEPALASLVPDALQPLLLPRLAEAANLLQSSAQSKKWQLSEKIAFLPTPQLQQAPAVNAEVLLTVQSALLDDCCVDVDYQSPYRGPAGAATQGADKQGPAEQSPVEQSPPAQGPAEQSTDKQNIPPTTASKYLLHPLALVQNGLQLYLLAFVDGYQDIRLFAVPRIRSAQLSSQPAVRPADFQLQSYLQSGALQFVSEPAIFTLDARVDNTLANLLAEAPLGSQMHLAPAAGPGWWQLTTAISDSWNLRLWLQSQGSRIEVLSPPWLRQQMQDELQRTLALYQR